MIRVMNESPAQPVDVEREGYVSTATFLYWTIPAVLAVLTIVAFLPSLGNDFVWDDEGAIARNEHIGTLSPESLGWMFTTFYTGPYQPLSWLSLALDVRLWGRDSAFGFHLTSVVLHALSAVVFYFVAYKLLLLATGRPGSTSSAGSEPERWVPSPALSWSAGAAAVVFALHPLRVESVAWATERRDVLSGLFFLLTVWSYVRFGVMDVGAIGRKAWYVVSVVFALMALLSKGTAVSLPVVLLVLDAYPLRRFQRRSGAWWNPVTERILAEKVPFFLLAFAAGILAILGQADAGAMMGLEEQDIASRMIVALSSFGFYVKGFVLPVGLSPLYEMPAGLLDIAVRLVEWILVGVGLTVLVLWKRQRYPGLLWAWVAYVVMLLPMSGLVQVGVHVAADRYSYLPSLSLSLVVAGGFLLWWRRGDDEAELREPIFKAPVVAVIALSMICMLLTWRQCSFWENDVRLWERAVAVDEGSGLAYYNLGDAWARSTLLDWQQRREQSLAAYREATRNRPDLVLAWQNLGNVLLAKGEAKQAIEVYDEGLSQSEGAGEIVANMQANKALAQLRLEDLDGAIESAKQALSTDSNHAPAYNVMGLAYQQKGEVEPALEAFQKSLEVDVQHIHAYENIIRLLLMLQRWGEAVDMLRRARQALPEEHDVSNTLAWVLATCPRDEIRDGQSAVRIAKQLCAETGNENINYLATYAAALAETGDFEAAVRVLDRAVGLAELEDSKMAARLKGRRKTYETRQPTRMD